MSKQKTPIEKPVKRTMIGGQALMEGVMMRGATSMAMAVRTEDGVILTETQRIKKPNRFLRIPVVRGCASFISSLVSGTRTLLKSAEAAFPEEDTPSKGWFTLSAILGVVLAIGLFFALPAGGIWLLERFVPWFSSDSAVALLVSSLIEGAIRLTIFVLYLFITSRIKDIRRTFMYHGAEHRTINCYEKGLPLTVENVQSCSTRHNRCGTTFLFFVMMVSILVFAFAKWLYYKVFFIEIQNDALDKLALFGVRLILLPVVAGLSYELLRLLAKLPDNVFTDILRAPGLALQRLTTYPPDDDMAEVAIKSFQLVEAMEADAQIQPIRFGEVPLADLRALVRKKLTAAGITDESETEWLLAAGLKKKRSALSALDKVDSEGYRRTASLAKKRADGKPLDYLTGFSEFYGYKLKVNEHVLLPRMETEQVVETAISLIRSGDTVLDLMTGSGCIAHVLAHKTEGKVTASDISAEALKIARRNLKDLPVEVAESDLFAAFEGRKFDVIVSNPPYIAEGEKGNLQKEVLCQPHLALFAGEDGLDLYRRIALEAPDRLNKGGRLVLEIGHTQAAAVTELLAGAFTGICVKQDLSGSDRIVTAIKKD